MDTYKAATTVLESFETVLRIDSGEIHDLIPRDGIARQTSPEGYRYGDLKQLYLYEEDDVIDFYRNIGIDQNVAKGEKVAIVQSNVFNF